MEKTIKKNVFKTIILIGLLIIVSTVFESYLIPQHQFFLAVHQFNEDGAREIIRMEDLIFNYYHIALFLVGIMVTYAIWEESVKQLLKKKTN